VRAVKFNRRLFGLMLAAIAFGVSSTASAADSSLGRDIAANCANCHGTNGRSVGVISALAGRPQRELVAIVTEFRDGKRPSTVMQQLAKGYSDAQIEAVAAYLAAQKP
jgi:cytochrome subunit of sulfide dehydrogenase